MITAGSLRRTSARAAVLVFLAAALAVGGASLEGEFAQAVFFAASGLVLAGLFAVSPGWIRGPAISVLLFTLALAGLLVAQIIPLDVALTGALPGRDAALASLAALGFAPRQMTLSLAPEASLAGLIAFLGPLAGFCLVAAIRWRRSAGMLKWGIPALGAASALLGLAQVLLGKAYPELYFYDFTTRGLPVGVFSNPNHQASFLLMCLPFVAALGAQLQRDWEGSDVQSAQATYVIVTGLLLITGIFGAGSAAGYLLLAPVLVLSASLFLAGRTRSSVTQIAGVAMVPLVLAFAALVVFTSPRLSGLGVTSFEDGPGSRIGINKVSSEMIETYWQAGTGLGTYASVYNLHEDPGTVTGTFIAHAHNDYFEWIIETGMAGAALLGLFLVWWFFQLARLWSRPDLDGLRLRRAASVACLVPVLHSLVDYPLRTPGIAALAGVCLAIMVVTRPRKEAPIKEREDTETIEETRNVVI